MAHGSSSNSETRHPIQVVARRSGLTADVLRAWEKRYGVVRPTRSPGGRRLYSNADIERLILLREATDAGRRIGDVAEISSAELDRMVREDREARARVPSPAAAGVAAPPTAQHLDRALAAVRSLDGPRLEIELERAIVLLSPTVLIDEVVAPLMTRIGDLWWEGALDPGQEHLASAIVQRTLAKVAELLQTGAEAPRILVATPSGQRHEIGASLVAAAAAANGWRVLYLGPDLPAADIASAAHRGHVDIVALSIIHPADDPNLGDELRQLRQKLDGGIAIVVGGRAVPGYRQVLDEIKATVLADVHALRPVLEQATGARGRAAMGGAET